MTVGDGVVGRVVVGAGTVGVTVGVEGVEKFCRRFCRQSQLDGFGVTVSVKSLFAVGNGYKAS